MTRLKKELKKAGFRFEEDFPFLPYNSLESVTLLVWEHRVVIFYEYSTVLVRVSVHRDFSFIWN